MASYGDSYLMDMENNILRTSWCGSPIFKGFAQLADKKWMALVREHIDAGHTETHRDNAMIFYTQWVTGGGGDIWFVDESSTHRVVVV